MSEPNVGDSSSSETIQVRVKTLEDRELVVSIGLQETVEDLTNKALALLSTRPTNNVQRIIYHGRVLSQTQTIQSVGIQHLHTVHLVNRSPGGHNDRPNPTERSTNSSRSNVNFFANMTAQVVRDVQIRPVSMTTPPTTPQVPSIRVPAIVNSVPMLAANLSSVVIHQETFPLRNRPDNRNRAAQQTPEERSRAFAHEAHAIHWTARISDGLLFRPRESIEQIIKDTVSNIPFIADAWKSKINYRWDPTFNELRIELPQFPPHIPSPALEKLDFLCMWTENLGKFIDKVEEEGGLFATAKRVLEMAEQRLLTDGLQQNVREQRIWALDAIVTQLETISNETGHMKDYERARFKKTSTEEYRNLKLEQHEGGGRNPSFVMRHALDIDMTVAMREFRKQRRRFATLEDLMDDLIDSGALKYARDIMTSNRDYRYQSLSIYFHFMQRMRHQLAHMTHVSSELDVSFLTPTTPQRLLPQYALNGLTVPNTHAATIVLKFVGNLPSGQLTEAPITTIMSPPRLASDVGDRAPGDWPYLPYNPPGVMIDAVVNTSRVIRDRRDITRADHVEEGASAFQPYVPPEPVHYNLRDLEFMASRMLPMRRYAAVGDQPSVPIDTWPPPGEARRQTTRFNVQPDARGPSTNTLAPFPVTVEPNELQRIAKNIASRYRGEALQRIAANLTARFNEESWDTRLHTMPLCTLREAISICLELLVSAGSNVNESKDLMLALVRDEEVLVRAIAECVKSLFGRGEFPTHVARLIMPRNEAASARTDYEAVDGEETHSEELEAMIVRVPSDVSQPQSGDLRAIRDRRATRRQLLENRPRITATSSPTNPPGPSFNPEDAADIRAGRLPINTRGPRRVPREAAVMHRAESPSQMTLTITATTAFAPSTSDAQFTVPVAPATVRSPVADVVRTPSPPVSTPRNTSAPATVASSPTNSDPVVAAVTRHATAAARAARAEIDRIAAAFNGNLSEARRNPEGRQRARNGASRGTESLRPIVAIDPFMNCNSRHCEVHRVQNSQSVPDSDRYTLMSLVPDPELVDQMPSLRPTGERRAEFTPATDDDYNYSVHRHPNGEIEFQDLAEFQKFVRTSMRSIMSLCVDTDTLITMNMLPIPGYLGGSSSGEYMAMVRRYMNPPTQPMYSSVPRGPTRNRAFSAAVNVESDFIYPGILSTLLTQLVEYLNVPSNPRPPGLAGFVLESIYGRWSRFEFSQLARRSSAETIFMQYEAELRTHLRNKYLEGRRGWTNEQLHVVAANIANPEEFFHMFELQNSELPTSLTFGPEQQSTTVSVVWTFRIVEMAAIKSLLTLAAAPSLDAPTSVGHIIDVIDTYMYRMMMLFYRLVNRDPVRHRALLRRAADFIAFVRFGGPDGPFRSDFLNGWYSMIDYWYIKYADLPEDLFTDFILMTRVNQRWNDVQLPPSSMEPEVISNPVPPPYISSPVWSASASSSASTISQPGTSSGSTSNNTVSNNSSRKRNHARTHEFFDSIDVVAPMMTSLSTSSPITAGASSSSPSSSSAPGPSHSADDVEMEDAAAE